MSTTLLLSLPNEHQLRLSKYKTAQELWAAILKTFGGNEATKKTKKNLLKQQYGNFKAEGTETLEQTFNRLQVIVSQLEFMDIEIEHDDLNQKFLTSLAPEWLMHAIVWRNMSDLDTISLDDLYNHLKDINQIYEDDMEEMDIKWNMALLSIRADRFWKKTRNKITIQGLPGVKTGEGETTTYKGLSKNMMFHYKAGLSQVEGRLAEFKNQEIKFCEKIKGLELQVEFKTNRIKSLTNELKLLKKEKGKLDTKLTGFQTASKNLDNLLESQRSDKNKEGLGYSAIPPLSAQFYSPPTKDMSWTGLPEFVDDTITDYSRPSPTVESKSDDLQNRNPFVTETKPLTSTILSKPHIKFVKATDRTTKTKTAKPIVKYAELYRKPTKRVDHGSLWAKNNNPYKSKTPRIVFYKTGRPPIKTNRPYMNAAQPKRTSFYKPTHSYNKRPFQRTSAVRSQFRGPRVATVNRKFPTVNRKLPTINRKFPTGNTKFSTADMGNKGTTTFFLKTRDETSGIFRNFITEIENLKELKVKIIRCDNKGEFRNKEMNDFCSRKGIKREFSNARTPQQNGVAERRNRTLIEAARTMLADAKLLVTFWAEAVNTACYIQNKVLVNKSQNKTPYELFNGMVAGINSTNLSVETSIPTVSSPVPTACFEDSQEPTTTTKIISKRVTSQDETPSLDTILTLANRFDDILGVTTSTVDSHGEEADEEGIDYDEVFAPVVRIEAIRLFLAYASFMGFTVYQMDVKSDFLYGTIDEEVYVMQPPRFQDPEFPARVNKVKKSNVWITSGSSSLLCREFEALIHEKFQMSAMVKRIFRYLKGHPKLGLWYPKESPFDLVAYSDSNYGGATQDRKPTTKGCQFLGRRLIFWQCKKKKIMATSITEAEYAATASGCGQVLWIQN
nr:ribonuclease H-like domain-containing protein [Tanacetum cinerariifolium]